MLPSIAPYRRALLGSVILAASLLGGALHPGHAAATIGGSRNDHTRTWGYAAKAAPMHAVTIHSISLSSGRGAGSSAGKP